VSDDDDGGDNNISYEGGPFVDTILPEFPTYLLPEV
jgi:hypothetical protein